MKSFFLLVAILISFSAFTQKALNTITQQEVERIERTLAADSMQGRATFSPGIDKAASFIAAEFKKAGLQTFKNDGFLQSFSMMRLRYSSSSGQLDGAVLTENQIAVLSTQKSLSVNEQSGYEKVIITAQDTLQNVMRKLNGSEKNLVILVDTSHSRFFSRFKRALRQSTEMKNSILMILGNTDAKKFSIEYKQEIEELKLNNVVGILPGKSKKDEYVIFSAHYDHLGISKPTKEGDSIYNGANDDASGTTAVILLSKYFKTLGDNERTLVFAAFTAEESGGFGSQYFSKQFPAEKVMAMFNIEMIGTESKWGTNSAFITGYEKSDMGKILEKNLHNSAFKFYPDPYPKQQLFYRSDNATLARLGVPAHTISTSKMDSEQFYHTADDEVETLDLKNMTEIIKAIALSSVSIVAGKDTPSRVDTTQLR